MLCQVLQNSICNSLYDLTNFTFSSAIRLDFKKVDWVIAGNQLRYNSRVQLQLVKTISLTLQVIMIHEKIVKIISSKTLSESAYNIPVSMGNATAGIWIVQLITNNQVFAKKIIK